MLPLFDEAPEVDRTELRRRLTALASQRIYFGGSSWKYEGWLGSVYTPERYFVRGRFSKKRFEETCLQEYGEVFPTVCGDFSYYNFPSESFWQNLFTTAPQQLCFSFKAPEMVTVAAFPHHARYGSRAGMPNPGFLDAGLLNDAFLALLRPYAKRVATIIIEFSAFPRKIFEDDTQFVEALNAFLTGLPDDFRYAVEIRNPEFFDHAYLDCLRQHRVAHVFNAWTKMPTLNDQIAVPESLTTDLIVARALLRQGRNYEDAVRSFTPYDRIQDENPELRDALEKLAQLARLRRVPAYLYVNNRLEGNAPGTIQAVVNRLPLDQ